MYSRRWSIFLIEGLDVDEDLSNEEVLVEIFHRQVRRLRNKVVASVKKLYVETT